MAFNDYLKRRIEEAGGKVEEAVNQTRPTTRPTIEQPTGNQLGTGGSTYTQATTQTTPVNNAAPVVPPANPTADITKTYIDRLTDSLAGKDATVLNARNTAGTQNAVGDYIAKREGRQESVNAGYTPGTLQSQRTMDRFQAGANETALARDNQVNELQRQRSDSALGAANQLRTEGRADIDAYINSFEDPVTRSYLRGIKARGGDVMAAGNQTGGQGGTGNNGGQTGAGNGGNVDPITGLPISKTPAEIALEVANNEVHTFYPNLDPNSDEFKELVRARTSGATEAELRTIQEANKASKLKDANTKALANFNSLSPQETALLLENTPSLNPVEVPVGAGAFNAFKATHPLVQIGGKLYKPVDTLEWRQGQNRDFSVFQAPDGTYLYVDKNGRSTTTQAPAGADATHQGRATWMETFK